MQAQVAASEDQVAGQPPVGGSRWPLLDWLPDETLFSLCSRQHRFWGHAESSATTQVLFGDSVLGNSHDFPKGLEEFAGRTGRALGDARELATERTLLRFCKCFLTPRQFNAAVLVQAGVSLVHVKRRLGLLNDGMRGDHPLKACVQCLDEDLARLGWRYWHLSHQVPGVWVCKIHGCALHESTARTRWRNALAWSLPSPKDMASPEPQTRVGAIEAVGRFSSLAQSLTAFSRPAGSLAAQSVRDALLQRLEQRGWSLAGRTHAPLTAVRSYRRHCAALSGIAELIPLAREDDWTSQLLMRLTSSSSFSMHPLRILSMVDWLFEGADDFLEASRSGLTAPSASTQTEGSVHA